MRPGRGHQRMRPRQVCYELTEFDVAQLRAFLRVCAKRRLGLVVVTSKTGAHVGRL